jgi:hypothetical protein
LYLGRHLVKRFGDDGFYVKAGSPIFLIFLLMFMSLEAPVRTRRSVSNIFPVQYVRAVVTRVAILGAIPLLPHRGATESCSSTFNLLAPSMSSSMPGVVPWSLPRSIQGLSSTDERCSGLGWAFLIRRGAGIISESMAVSIPVLRLVVGRSRGFKHDHQRESYRIDSNCPECIVPEGVCCFLVVVRRCLVRPMVLVDPAAYFRYIINEVTGREDLVERRKKLVCEV